MMRRIGFTLMECVFRVLLVSSAIVLLCQIAFPRRHLEQSNAQINIVVATDGSGQFKTVQEAIMSVPSGSAASPVVIHIKPGTYKELIYIQHEKRFFHLVGEDAEKTILTFDLHANMIGPNGKPITTFRTPSTVIDADDFTAENITFENSAGPVGQALAIRVDGDRAVFRRCRFLGWQDTIFLNRGRQYFEECYINGHVDFIFGAATAFFARCHIHCRKNGYITAASTYDNQPFGFVFSHCKITGESADVKTYLGRPWRDFSNVIYLNTEMSDVVRPVGWQNWDLPAREKTARYAEFNSTGPGANVKARASWSRQLTKSQAREITVKKVLGGADKWNPGAFTLLPVAKIQAVLGPERESERRADKAIALWPNGAPGALGQEPGDIPTLTPYFPAREKATGAAIIVCPGGGYSHLADHEGRPVAEWLNSLGIIAFVLKYRLGPRYHHPAQLQDAARAMRTIRASAAAWHIDPKRIGVLGFSAGGHLASTIGTHFDAGSPDAADPIERVSSRPDAMILLYPVITMREFTHAGSKRELLGLDPPPELVALLSNDEQVTKETPPTFLVHTANDDAVPVENSLRFAEALRKMGVPFELHVFQRGPHGFGLGGKDPILSTWPGRCADWLRLQGFS